MIKDLTKLKKVELLELAKKKKIKGLSALKKADLIKILSKDMTLKSKAKAKPKQKLKKDKVVKRKISKGKTPKVLPKRKNAGQKKKIEEQDFSQELVESTKFYTGIIDSKEDSKSKRLLEESSEIAHRYGENTCVLLVRDPWCVFSYWEIKLSLWEAARLQCEGSAYKEVLRVYDVTGSEVKDLSKHKSYFDIELIPFVESWYINLQDSGRSYIAEIGLKKNTGEFFAMVRSNMVTTPRYGPSDLIDEEWMVIEEDYWKIFALSGGYGIGTSSEELQRVLRQKKIETISSSAKARLKVKS
jgi:hypothetical protein